jgi:hypothetical protein
MKTEVHVKDFSEATAGAVPSVVGYAPTEKQYVIGERARRLGLDGRPVAEGFKVHIGDGDAAFDGRQPPGGARPKLWSLDGELPETRELSTRRVAQIFLERLFARIPGIPKQLIVGVPATDDEGWQSKYRSHIRELLKGLGQEEPSFFPEPFAVFQYYRHVAKLIPESRQPLWILVVDFGGGTFDSCVIEATEEGNPARGGAKAVPLGISSVQAAGREIDRRILTRAISKVNDIRLKKEPLEGRLAARPGILLITEDMKIALSTRLHGCRLEDDCSQYFETRDIPRGFFHPDVSFQLNLNGEDLKKVVTELWMERLGPGICKTINDAKFRGGTLRFTQIDKVIVAGGSSGLPFVPQLIAKTLAGESVGFRAKDILVGRDCEKAVAYGLAIEAREQRSRYLKAHNSIGPCVFGRLFLYVASRRDEVLQKPYIKRRLEDGTELAQGPGLLLGGPMRIPDFEVEYEVKLPFLPRGAFFYWFCDKEAPDDPVAQRLNVQADVLRLPPDTPKTFRLRLHFSEDGFVHPFFRISEKEVRIPPFESRGLQISRDVESYAGIDLGTSNSYAVGLWAELETPQVKYPSFTISDSAGARLRALEQTIVQLRASGALTPESCKALAARRESDFVFHSIKIEGSGLTRGDTDELLGGRRTASTKEMIEPVNVRQAYEFILASHASYKEQPESFVREINKIALRGLDERAGAYRSGPVKITGTEFEPPPASELAPYMEKLAGELKEGPGARTVVHFAAEMHSKLVAIHPFVDANGRTARLLMNAILLDAGLPPGIIFFQDKGRYLDCLAESNRGDLSAMVILLAETVEAGLDELRTPEAPTIEPVAVEQPPLPVVESRPTSQRLADVMRKRIARLSVDRQARYEAWRAGFEAFREELRLSCFHFNKLYSNTLYRISYTPYDTLPFDKYETLLRGARTPRTWLLGIQLSSDLRRERFVFLFRPFSDPFRTVAEKSPFAKSVPPSDVTLGVSRWSDGMLHRLREEPIKLREVAYFDGQLVFLVSDGSGNLRVESRPAAEAVDDFLADAVEAFL